MKFINIRAKGLSVPSFVANVQPQAACHRDRAISKVAVTAIHDVVNSLLASQTELPYFHFNEALFKPFQNLLCLEMCDYEVQDQVCTLAESGAG